MADAVATGRKDDKGKPEWSSWWRLMPWDQVRQIGAVLVLGATKYAPENWKIVPGARERYSDALIRHIDAWMRGERFDPETNLSHLAHAACNLLFLMWFDDNPGKEVPTRP